MEKDELKKILLDNQEIATARKVVKRDLFIDYKSIEKLHKIVTISGPRRAGKTFFLYQICHDLKLQKEEIVFLDFSEIILHSFRPEDFDFLLRVYYELYPGKTPYFFGCDFENWFFGTTDFTDLHRFFSY